MRDKTFKHPPGKIYVEWEDIMLLRQAGRKITATTLYERQHVRDNSQFVTCRDYMTGPREFRIWPMGAK